MVIVKLAMPQPDVNAALVSDLGAAKRLVCSVTVNRRASAVISEVGRWIHLQTCHSVKETEERRN